MKTKASGTSSIQSKRCTWTKEEDQVLLNRIKTSSPVDWNKVADALSPLASMGNPPKTSKQCRERWHNKLNPAIKQSPWTNEEINLFFKLYRKYGSKWSKLAYEISGRTDNAIKNFFYCRLRRIARRIKKGIMSDSMRETASEVEHNIYLIHYLRNYYTHDSAHLPTDKYISDMISSTGITYQMINKYLKDYTKYSYHTIDTDDSFTKLPGTEIFPARKVKGDDLYPFRKSCTVLQTDATFLMQLLKIDSIEGKVTLPIPREVTVRNEKDEFLPTLNFTRSEAYNPGLLVNSYFLY